MKSFKPMIRFADLSLSLALIAGVIVWSGCADEPELDGGQQGLTSPPSLEKSAYPEAQNFVADSDDVLAATIHLAWDEPIEPPLSVQAYQVRINTDEPITTSEWATTPLLDEVSHIAPSYSTTYDARNLLFEPGDTVWLAVRPVYDGGPLGSVLGGLSEVIELRITEPAYISGTVIDDTGAALPGVAIVASADGFTTTTDTDGHYQVGPFSDEAEIILTTESPDVVSMPGSDDAWYDYFTDTIVAGTGSDIDITLLTRYEIELEDESPGTNNDHFSYFVYQLAATPYGGADAPIVFHWGTYPVAVYIPDLQLERVSDDGIEYIDVDNCVRYSMYHWNYRLGFEAFVEVSDPYAAKIDIRFDGLVGQHGSVKMWGSCGDDNVDGVMFACEPTGARMYLDVFEPYETTSMICNIAFHEFGHILSIWKHVSTPILENGIAQNSLMMVGGGSREYPLHSFEVKAAVAIRNMPQATQMSHYEGTPNNSYGNF